MCLQNELHCIDKYCIFSNCQFENLYTTNVKIQGDFEDYRALQVLKCTIFSIGFQICADPITFVSVNNMHCFNGLQFGESSPCKNMFSTCYTDQHLWYNIYYNPISASVYMYVIPKHQTYHNTIVLAENSISQ